jgi:glycosyltransferase involved in cell wall biosynthesis
MAHLIERKGVDVLLRALAHVDGRWQLVVAGTGESETRLRAMSRDLGIDDRVSWIGMAATHAFFADVDVVVVPSRADALPLVLLQAMAYGRPVIASAAGGIPEAAAHPVEALLVEPDDPRALAEAIRQTLGNPRAALSRARAARRRVERDFSLAATTRQYLNGYAALAIAVTP